VATTPNGLTYPLPAAAPNIAADIQALANAADHKVIGNFATAAARAAAITAPGDGDVTYRADSKVYEKYSSLASAWTFMPGQVVGTVKTATAYTSSGTNGTTETPCTDRALTVTNIEAGRNYFVEFGGLFVVSIAGTSAVLGIHALQGSVVVGSPVIASAQQPVASGGSAQQEMTFRQLWTPGASGTWNLLPGIKSSGGTGNSQSTGGTQNAFLTVVAA
jgi:hypothetical protein